MAMSVRSCNRRSAVHLTEREQGILDGKEGPYKAELMARSVALGEAMGAEKMVKVQNVMISGINVGGHYVKQSSSQVKNSMLRDVEQFLRCEVSCLTHTSGTQLDIDRWTSEPDEAEMAAYNEIIIQAFDAGVLLTWTCAPYLVGNIPGLRTICAWCESSAITYINSMLGARTNRNGMTTTIPAAVLGVIPEFGLLIDENRRGTVLVEVKAELSDPADWGALGYFAGEAAGLGIPVFEGIRRAPSVREAMQLSAALATLGGVSMFHIVGITPEAPSQDAAFQDGRSLQCVVFGQSELRRAYERLHTDTDDTVDSVVFGCPHAPLEEIHEVAYYLKGRRISTGVDLSVWTSHATRANARRLGYERVIEDAGGKLKSDSCALVLRAGGKHLVTNAFKQAHYARSVLRTGVRVAGIKQCVEAAVRGKWS